MRKTRKNKKQSGGVAGSGTLEIAPTATYVTQYFSEPPSITMIDDNNFPRWTGENVPSKVYISGPGIPTGTYTTGWSGGTITLENNYPNVLYLPLSKPIDLTNSGALCLARGGYCKTYTIRYDINPMSGGAKKRRRKYIKSSK